MKIGYAKIFRLLLLIGLIGELTACSTTSPNPRLYLLEPVETRSAITSDTLPIIILGPVTLPDYLNRKGILTRERQFRVSISEFDRWAEPLEQNIISVMVENIASLVHSDHVFNYQWGMADVPDFTVRIQILEFGPASPGNISLNVIWEITDRSNDIVELSKSYYSDSQAGDDMSSTVAAMSQVLGQLSRDIAKVLNEFFTSSGTWNM